MLDGVQDGLAQPFKNICLPFEERSKGLKSVLQLPQLLLFRPHARLKGEYHDFFTPAARPTAPLLDAEELECAKVAQESTYLGRPVFDPSWTKLDTLHNAPPLELRREYHGHRDGHSLDSGQVDVDARIWRSTVLAAVTREECSLPHPAEKPERCICVKSQAKYLRCLNNSLRAFFFDMPAALSSTIAQQSYDAATFFRHEHSPKSLKR